MFLVSVIIASFNAKDFLKKNLSSLLSEPGDFEIVVVDDGSTDQTESWFKEEFAQESRLKVIRLEKNLGSAKAKNIGVQNSRGRYLFFLDSDTETSPGWFKTIPEFFKNHSDCGLAQAKLLKTGTNLFDYAGDYFSPFGFLVERARSAPDQSQFDQVEPIFGLKTAGAIMRRDAFEEIGGFDEDFRIFWEDTDLAWRTWLAGWRVLFCSQVVVWHAFGTSKKSVSFYREREGAYQTVYLGCRNHLTTLLKNLSSKRLFLVLPAAAFAWSGLALFFLLRLRVQKTSAILKAFLWNLKHVGSTMAKRAQIQRKRRISDGQLLALIGRNPSLGYYLGKAQAYLDNKPF